MHSNVEVMVISMHLLHWLSILAAVVLLSRALLRIWSPFWSRQPVFHPYRLDLWWRGNTVIDNDVPSPDKYVTPSEQVTVSTEEIEGTTREEIVGLLTEHYLPKEHGRFAPTWAHLTCGMKWAPYTSSFTIGRGRTGEVISTISSRPLEVKLGKTSSFTVNYVDNLCIDKTHRGKGLAPRAIRTLYQDVREREPSIKACLFKREGQTMGIVPVTVYPVVAYQATVFEEWTRPVVGVTGPEGVRDCWENMREWSGSLEAVLCTSLQALTASVHSGSLLLLSVGDPRGRTGVGLFRDSACDYGEGKAIELAAYIQNPERETDESACILSLCREACAQSGAKMVLLDVVGCVGKAIKRLKDASRRPSFSSTTSLFFYNYASRPIKPSKCLLFF